MNQAKENMNENVNEQVNERVSGNLRYLRKAAGLTQDDLAKKMGVSRAQIGSYEEGRAMPKLSLLQFVASYFQCSLDDLVNKALWEPQVEAERSAASFSADKLRVLTAVVNAQNEERFAVVPEKASAGYTAGYSDPDFIEQLPVFDLPLPEFRSGNSYRVFQIKGDSMLPIPSGTYIIGEYVADAAALTYGEPHILVTESDGIVYKRIEEAPGAANKLLLRSDNPAYKAYTVDWANVLEIWRAVGYIATCLPGKQEVSRHKIEHLIADLKQELDQFNRD